MDLFGSCDLDLDRMSFIYELKLTYPLEMYTGCAEMNVLRQGFRKYRMKGGECVHLVTRGHFRSRGKDGGHTIRSVVVENIMLHANLMALSVMKPELLSIEVYIVGIGILDVFGSCNLDLDPMTFIYELDSYCRIIGCAK